MRWPQRAQTRGSTWQTLAIILAQLGEHRRLGGESAVATIASGSGGGGEDPLTTQADPSP
jgi:hypothetical protein